MTFPSNRDYDLEDKRAAYREAGVGEIWFVTPYQQVLVEVRRGKSYSERAHETGIVTSQALKGFWLDVAWLWRYPLPNRVACLRKILGER
jgi:Uma2 family endonuclease